MTDFPPAFARDTWCSLAVFQLSTAPFCARITVVRWFAVTNMSRSLSAEAYPLYEPGQLYGYRFTK